MRIVVLFGSSPQEHWSGVYQCLLVSLLCYIIAPPLGRIDYRDTYFRAPPTRGGSRFHGAPGWNVEWGPFFDSGVGGERSEPLQLGWGWAVSSPEFFFLNYTLLGAF